MRHRPCAPWVSGLLALIFGGCSCGDESGALTVELRTDFVAVEEMQALRVELFAGARAESEPERTVEPAVLASHDYIAGRRIAEWEGLEAGARTLRTTLLARDGTVLARRETRLDLRGRVAVTIVIARDCRNVRCGEGLTCFAGACVSTECVTGAEPACGDVECETDDACAVAAACARGVCADGACLAAPIDGACHVSEWCDPERGCLPRAGADIDAGARDGGGSDAGSADAGTVRCTGGDCDDGLHCNGVETCVEGVCAPGTPVTCDDGVACTNDRCAGAACEHVPNDGACTAASGGVCDPVRDCQYPTCTAATCLPGPCQSASCVGSECVRTSICAAGQVCCGGSCVAAGCDDGNACTSDACDGTRCTHAPNTDPCSDGNACTAGDRCAGGSCSPGSPMICDDRNPCTSDACTAGACVFSPTTASCDDGDGCTTGDTCTGSVCAGTPRVCPDDGNPCTSETCTGGACGFSTVSDGTRCDDGNPCTELDVCIAGSCRPGAARVCRECNVCNALGECMPDGDGMPCPGGYCYSGVCNPF